MNLVGLGGCALMVLFCFYVWAGTSFQGYQSGRGQIRYTSHNNNK